MTEQEIARKRNKKWAMDRLLPFFQICPQIVKQGIGTEAFVEDLNKACNEISEYFFGPEHNEWDMDTLLMFLKACPQVVQPGIGAQAFAEELIKASGKIV